MDQPGGPYLADATYTVTMTQAQEAAIQRLKEACENRQSRVEKGPYLGLLPLPFCPAACWGHKPSPGAT